MDYLLLNKLSAIFLSILILGLATFTAKVYKNWLIPSVVFSVFWFLFTFFPLTLAFSVPINADAILYILIANVFFMSSAFIFDWKHASKIFESRLFHVNDFSLLNEKSLVVFFYCSQAFVTLSIFLDILLQGFSFSDVFFDLINTSASYIALRYTNSLESSMVTRFGTVFLYVGSILGGIVFCYSKSKSAKTVVVLISLLPSLLVMVIQGAKGALFLCMFLFYGSLVIGRLYTNKFSLTDNKTNKVLFMVVLLVLPAITFSFLSRGLYGESDDFVVKKIIFYFNSYAFSHLYAFADWFDAKSGYDSFNTYIDLNNVDLGFQTFMSIFKFFGDTRFVPPGYYDEYYNYNGIIQSNIYTIFRGVILDFGIFGSLVFMFLLGFVLNVVFYLMLMVKRPFFFIAIYICMFGFFYSSMVISLLVWNSMYISFLIVYLIFLFSAFKYRSVFFE